MMIKVKLTYINLPNSSIRGCFKSFMVAMTTQIFYYLVKRVNKYYDPKANETTTRNNVFIKDNLKSTVFT
jgi:hypothetical protein